MKANGKVYVLISFGKYEEITYSELLRLCACNEEYRRKRFYPLHGILMEVSEKDYMELYKADRRQKYLKEEAILHREISYNALDSDEMSGEETITDSECDVQESVDRAVMTEYLYQCLNLLTKDEFDLIRALYFEGKSERIWSAETGLPQKTINNRKRAILAKLKKLMGK
ncbi:MAG: sigma-70 family RNA polymerase sigma factor [Eubacteriales bacterium]|nr:sigma-70 family RNA polymerase sigma factor [Eubacteriales bacterium]